MRPQGPFATLLTGGSAEALIVTVTPNAALDRTVAIDALRPGTRRCAAPERSQAGGKGVNVARVLRGLGIETHVVALVGGAIGAEIGADLEAAGLPATCVEAPGESRVCLELVEASGRATQLHGPGVEADESSAVALLETVAERLRGARWLALCGSLPPGMPDDLYARLIACARDCGVPCALDASGEALRLGWAAHPDLLRINRDEAAEALGVERAALALPAEAGPGRCERGIVSDGAGPVIAWSADGARWTLQPPAVEARNAIGCGDAMLAGVLASLAAGRDFESAVRAGVALGAADAESPVAGRPDPARAAVLESGVVIEASPAP
ncbi:MAG: hexose kinase [Myxococcota bacterium]|nr:hexose kinase [Myxococcota bacterium]